MGRVVIDKGGRIDVLFLAEGTYPYIRGGVSSWIHQIITGMPDLHFGVLFLGSREEDYGDIAYHLPENLVFLSTFYIFSARELPMVAAREGRDEVFLLKGFFSAKEPPDRLSDYYFYTQDLPFEEFLYGKRTFEMLEELYLERQMDIPFGDYLWTMRNIFTPLWVVVKALESVMDKEIRSVHSPSTGFAGLLGSMLKRSRGLPFILTEHGIYTWERKIDIVNIRWIKRLPRYLEKKYDVDELKKLWIAFFEGIGRITYLWADQVFSLFEKARQVQIKLGCPFEKTRVIHNGVEIERFRPLRKREGETIPAVVALIGRVTPIKDVKTFIKAIKVLVAMVPEAEGWVIGHEDEDPRYAQACRELVKALRLEDQVKFWGFQQLTDIFPKIGLTTLTSISEGMPLVVLESFAAGVPAVTTEVGSCRQLIHGGVDEEDRGKAGEVVAVTDFRALAEAYRKFLTDAELWWCCSKTAVARVEKYYSFTDFIRNYREVYEEFMSHGRDIYRAQETLKKG